MKIDPVGRDPRHPGPPDLFAVAARWRQPVPYRGLDPLTDLIYITSSGMLQERLLRRTLDFTSAERVMFSTDYPFHRPDATATGQFFDAIADPAERAQIAFGNAATLFGLA